MRLFPRLAGLFAIVLWSAGALLVLALHRLPPFQLMASACTISLLCVALFTGVTGRWRNLRFTGTFVMTTIILWANQICYVFAFRSAPAVQVDLINYLWPSMLVLAQGRSMSPFVRVMVIGAGTLGVALALGPEGLHWKYMGGYMTALSAALLWTTYSIISSKEPQPTESIGLSVGLAAPMYWGLHFWSGAELVIPDAMEWSILLLYGGGLYFAGYCCWNYATKEGPVAEIGALSYLIPLLSVLFLAAGGYATFDARIAWATFFVLIAALIPMLPDPAQWSVPRALKFSVGSK